MGVFMHLWFGDRKCASGLVVALSCEGTLLTDLLKWEEADRCFWFLRKLAYIQAAIINGGYNVLTSNKFTSSRLSFRSLSHAVVLVCSCDHHAASRVATSLW
jgi:hypothetical protein